MPIDCDHLLAQQLKITEPSTVQFDDGRKTLLQPVRQIPRVDAPESTLCLDGEWKVRRWPFPKNESVLAAPRTSDSSWDTVVQPGKVLYADGHTDGRSIPNWNRVTQAHHDPEDGAVLRRSVTVPSSWRGKRIMLRFDGIYPASRIYLDGQLLGEHLSGLTPAEFDVTEQVKPGKKALIAVRLLRRHEFVQLDMPRHACDFAGLAQSACLFAVEPCHIDTYHLISELDRKLALGSVNGTVSVSNTTALPQTTTLKTEILDADGKVVAQATTKGKPAAGQAQDLPVKLKIKSPKLWNDEFPNLYTVRLTLSVPKQAVQTISYKTGFRRFDLSPEGPKLNGNFVKFRGVNHLTFHPDHGMHTPKEWLYDNLRMMKKANINCVRTHFLGPRDLSDVCDELGMYLVQELPIDWGTNYIHKPEWVGPTLMRIMAGILRDRHHPSVMLWAVGNENMPETQAATADGWNHLSAYERFTKMLDPTRPNMFPPPGPANKIRGIFELRFGDVADIHYSFKLAHEFLKDGKCVQPRSWEADMEVMTREKALKRGWSGVWFSSEYGIFNMIPDLLNAPYQSIITDTPEGPLSGLSTQQTFVNRMKREWSELMRAKRNCLGGAFFPWIGAGTAVGDHGHPWGWVRWAEDADWGPICADLTPKPFFWAMRALYSPVYFPERYTWKKGARDLAFEIDNQFNAIDLKDCTIRTQFGSGKWLAMMRAFQDAPIACAPGRKKKVRLPIWNKDIRKSLDGGSYAVCRVSLMDPKGFRVITHDILIIPEALGGEAATEMPIGPDAKL